MCCTPSSSHFSLAGKRIVSGKFPAKIYCCFACLRPEACRLETMCVTQQSIYFHPICDDYHLQNHKPCIFPVVPSPPSYSIALQFKRIFWSHHNGGKKTLNSFFTHCGNETAGNDVALFVLKKQRKVTWKLSP